jgi:hypothetical protein
MKETRSKDDGQQACLVVHLGIAAAAGVQLLNELHLI